MDSLLDRYDIEAINTPWLRKTIYTGCNSTSLGLIDTLKIDEDAYNHNMIISWDPVRRCTEMMTTAPVLNCEGNNLIEHPNTIRSRLPNTVVFWNVTWDPNMKLIKSVISPVLRLKTNKTEGKNTMLSRTPARPSNTITDEQTPANNTTTKTLYSPTSTNPNKITAQDLNNEEQRKSVLASALSNDDDSSGLSENDSTPSKPTSTLTKPKPERPIPDHSETVEVDGDTEEWKSYEIEKIVKYRARRLNTTGAPATLANWLEAVAQERRESEGDTPYGNEVLTTFATALAYLPGLCERVTPSVQVPSQAMSLYAIVIKDKYANKHPKNAMSRYLTLLTNVPSSRRRPGEQAKQMSEVRKEYHEEQKRLQEAEAEEWEDQ
ncbi:hypothetical protein AYO20_08430 [Fonsecaea nubica]|uniref:Uncharacterized protein n=1 Tax=Fonsecaea nubica TaxID=856822 RepID=A0A178CMQ9_9EURO|nr:hypothetical protein AYO20_08430 [Fonsecaea nubica]OAL31099.1 hypothetical protein AYO20_08430 [Fonsecaea nubica]